MLPIANNLLAFSVYQVRLHQAVDEINELHAQVRYTEKAHSDACAVGIADVGVQYVWKWF